MAKSKRLKRRIKQLERQIETLRTSLPKPLTGDKAGRMVNGASALAFRAMGGF